MTQMTVEHKRFLDDLRESGDTNMFGAAPYVQEEFGVTRAEARAIVSAWMASFGKEGE
jgi:hypothetical protein